MLEFRLLNDDDIPLIEVWLNKDYVKIWYEIPRLGITIDDWISEMKEHKGEFQWITYLIRRRMLYWQSAMQSIGTLSGGEQAKVKMCLLMLRKCNFLIMDEPTNHLDVQAKEALKDALCEFPGTVILVSHEEAFYRDWTQRVIDVGK